MEMKHTNLQRSLKNRRSFESMPGLIVQIPLRKQSPTECWQKKPPIATLDSWQATDKPKNKEGCGVLKNIQNQKKMSTTTPLYGTPM